MNVIRAVLPLAAFVLLTTACTDNSSSTQVQSVTLSTPASTPTLKPVTDTESFVAALEAAGYKVKERRVVIPPGYGGFQRFAQRIFIGRYYVYAFEFATVSAYDRMRSRISDDGQRIGDATFVWNPHLYGSGRLIVLYEGNRPSPIRDALNTIFGKQFAGV